MQTFLTRKILERPANSFSKPTNIEILKRTITGLRKVEALKITFHKKRIRRNEKKKYYSVSAGNRSGSIIREHRSLSYRVLLSYRSKSSCIKIFLTSMSRVLMMKHFRSDVVIFGCIPLVYFYNLVALFQLNSRET